jgi:hypothetical protein
MRAAYLQSNPSGEFNKSIERGEVAVGMRFEVVVASWGIPDARERVDEGAQERWTYTITDVWSRDWIRYDFFFEKKALASWETMRNVSSGQTIGDPAPVPTGLPLPANGTGLVSGSAPRR